MAKIKLKPTTDPIADMLARLRNSQAVGQQTVSMPYSQLKEAILALLKRHGFIVDYSVLKDDDKVLEAKLRNQDSNGRLSACQRISKPGRRQYVKASAIPRVRGGRGICIISTSQGLLAGHEAKRKGLGGELIAKVW